MILTFLIIFLVVSAWDVMHVNHKLDDLINPTSHR